QVDDLVKEIDTVVKAGNKVMVTTLTKNMAENLSEYFKQINTRAEYLHNEIDTIQRAEIIRKFRLDEFDVLVGINLLREGLDIPEVALVAILDADKEGFLRDARSLIQTIGRASRNVDGRVIMYADTMTRSMRIAIDETNRRRQLQVLFNQEHGIKPTTIVKAIQDSLSEELAKQEKEVQDIEEQIKGKLDSEIEVLELIHALEIQMMEYANQLKFEQAAYLRDKINDLKVTYLKKH
nr:helicase-related protein [Candidatus Sigynarchaeota archaeon]